MVSREPFYFLFIELLDQAVADGTTGSINVFGPTNFIDLEAEGQEFYPRLRFLAWDTANVEIAVRPPSLMHPFGLDSLLKTGACWQNADQLAVIAETSVLDGLHKASIRVLASHRTHWKSLSAQVVWHADLAVLNSPRRIDFPYARKRRRVARSEPRSDVVVHVPDFITETVDTAIPVVYKDHFAQLNGVMIHHGSGHADIILIAPVTTLLPGQCNGGVWYKGVQIAEVGQ